MFSILPWHRITDRDAAPTRCHILPREDEAAAVCRGRRRRERANEEERQDAHTPRPFLARHFSAHSLPPLVGDFQSLSRISAVRGCASSVFYIRDIHECASADGNHWRFFWAQVVVVVARTHESSFGRGGWMDGRTPLLPPPAFPSSSTVAEKGPRPPMLYTVRTGTFCSYSVREWRARATCPKILSGLSARDATLHFVPVARMHSPAAFVAMPGGAWRENATHSRTEYSANEKHLERNYWAERGRGVASSFVRNFKNQIHTIVILRMRSEIGK